MILRFGCRWKMSAGRASSRVPSRHSVQSDLDFRVINGAGRWVTYEAAEGINAALREMFL